MKVTKLFTEFTNSEKASGLVLIICTSVSLVLANSSISEKYINLWEYPVLNKSTEFWINDGLMTIFFLLVGLEIEREIYIGELADIRKSLLPVFAAIGGMLIPGLIHFGFNNGTATQNGFGIPMATDIAFSLAVLSLLGKRVPATLKLFLTALAIIDDLGAIVVIAVFYSGFFSVVNFLIAILIFIVMIILKKKNVLFLWLYLILGCGLWFFMHRSGIHATISGILIAFAIPFGTSNQNSLSHKLQSRLHLPVAFIILPLFALANTAISINPSLINHLPSLNSYGIFAGLVLGKPLGIFLFSLIGIAFGLCKLPEGLTKRHIFLTGMIAGIGFTMSMFITLLAFKDSEIVNVSKITIICSSLVASSIGYTGLRITLKKQ